MVGFNFTNKMKWLIKQKKHLRWSLWEISSDRITEKYNLTKQSIDSLSRIQAKMQIHTKRQEDSLKVSEIMP